MSQWKSERPAKLQWWWSLRAISHFSLSCWQKFARILPTALQNGRSWVAFLATTGPRTNSYREQPQLEQGPRDAFSKLELAALHGSSGSQPWTGSFEEAEVEEATV